MTDSRLLLAAPDPGPVPAQVAEAVERWAAAGLTPFTADDVTPYPDLRTETLYALWARVRPPEPGADGAGLLVVCGRDAGALLFRPLAAATLPDLLYTAGLVEDLTAPL